MRNLFVMGMMALVIVSCNSKTESKKVDVPKPKTGKAEEIINSLYSVNKGYECDLDLESKDSITKVFYIDRTETREDKALFHKFYTVTEGSDKVDTDIKIGNFSMWMINYKSENDELYSASTPVTDKSEEENKGLYKLKINYDSKVNEFDLQVVSQEFVDTSFVEKDIVENGKITNCVEASYKIIKGLD